MERAEIAELFYNALIDANKSEQLAQFLSARVKWILSTADPHVGVIDLPPQCPEIFRKGRLSTIGTVLPGWFEGLFRRPHRLR
jgi:hypothetical protein